MAKKNKKEYQQAYYDNEADANKQMSFVNAAAGVLAGAYPSEANHCFASVSASVNGTGLASIRSRHFLSRLRRSWARRQSVLYYMIYREAS